MNRLLLPGLLLLVAAPLSRAEAANLAVIANPPTMLNLLVLIGAVIGAAGACKVWSSVRGGRLSKGWQWFIGGFAALAAAQIILLCQMFEILTLPEFVVPTLLTVMAGLFLGGVLETKRTLG